MCYFGKVFHGAGHYPSCYLLKISMNLPTVQQKVVMHYVYCFLIQELFPEITDPPPLTMTMDDYMDRAPQYVMYQARTIYDNITITPEHLGEV